MVHPSVRAVVPSYRPDLAELTALLDALRTAGADPVVLANGKPALETAERAGLPLLAPGRNAGFGPSIRWAVEHLDPWDWLILANDDLRIDGPRFAAALAELGTGDVPEIVHLDEDVERPLPGPLDVFANVSLLARAVERVRPARGAPAGGGYRSFSCVAISRRAWETTGGLDPALPFTYEDADFVKRLVAAGGSTRVAHDAGVHHERSLTSSRAVADVLPIATWSSLLYLRKWWRPRGGVAPLLVAAALLLRIVLLPFGRADRRAHLTGIGRALRAVLLGRAPSMPPYDPIRR
jgi:GT2 family glycosyltransferase